MSNFEIYDTLYYHFNKALLKTDVIIMNDRIKIMPELEVDFLKTNITRMMNDYIKQIKKYKIDVGYMFDENNKIIGFIIYYNPEEYVTLLKLYNKI